MKKSKAYLTALAAMAMSTSMIVPTAAATNDADLVEGTEDWSYTTNYNKLLISPGADETKLNFAWYSTEKDVKSGKAMVQVTEQSNIKNGEWPSNPQAYRSYKADVKEALKEKEIQYYTNRAEADGFKENTAYAYRYTSDGKTWSPIYSYTTKDFDEYSVMYVGDPQIGASGNAQADVSGWAKTLSTATAMFPNLSNIISVGDQTNSHDNASKNINQQFEAQMAGYLDPSQLRSLPVATLVGNHEAGGKNFFYHTNNPNQSSLGSTAAGADYWYTYGNTLYLVLNTNNSNAAEHESFIKEAVEKNPDAAWTVAMFHQDIYGSGAPHSDSDGADVRRWIDPVLNKFDIDVVLTGHDHSYTRSYQLKDGQIVDVQQDEKGRIVNPDGMVYMTANSATGSKYYDLAPKQQYYVAYREQTNQRSFSVLDVDDVSFSIRTYNAETGAQIDDTYTIVKSATYEDLMDLTKKVEEQLKNTESYTPKTVSALKQAQEAALKLENTEDLSEETIADTYADLKNALSGLTEKANKDNLHKQLETAGDLLEKAIVGNEEGQYPKEAKDELQKAYDEAMTVFHDENTVQPEADKAYENLQAAITKFKSSVNASSSQSAEDNTGIGGNGTVDSNHQTTDGASDKDGEASSDDEQEDKKDQNTAQGNEASKDQSIPQTGEDSYAAMLAAGTIIPLGVIGGYVIYMNKRKKTEE